MKMKLKGFALLLSVVLVVVLVLTLIPAQVQVKGQGTLAISSGVALEPLQFDIVSISDIPAYGVIEPSGCGEYKGRVKLRIDMFMEPDAPYYDKHYVEVLNHDIIPTYGGKVLVIPIDQLDSYMEQGIPFIEVTKEYFTVPENLDDYYKWWDGIVNDPQYYQWQNNSFHSHFIYYDTTVGDENIKLKIADVTEYFYAFHLHCWDSNKTFIEEWVKVPIEDGAVREPFVKGLEAKVDCEVKADDIVSRLIDFDTRYFDESRAPPPDLNIGDKGTIDIGADATNRGSAWTANFTLLSIDNPANATGTIDTFSIYANASLSGFWAGTFFLVSGTTYECRDSENIGNVTAGAPDPDNFTGLDCDVEVDDLAGCYFTGGAIDRDWSGGLGLYHYSGEAKDPSDQASYSLITYDVMSLYGTGTEATSRQVIIGNASDRPLSDYASPFGQGGATWYIHRYDKYEIIPTSGTLTNFKVSVYVAPGEGDSQTFTIHINDAATDLSVTISDTETISPLDTSEVSVSAGDTIVLGADGGGDDPLSTQWTFEFIPDTAGETILMGNSDSENLYDGEYQALASPLQSTSSEYAAEIIFPTSGTLKKFYSQIETAPGSGKSWTFTIRKNNVSQTLATTISDTSTTDYDTSNTVDISAGDTACILVSSSGGPGANQAYYGIVFVPDTPGEFITPMTNKYSADSSATEFQPLTSAFSSPGTTEYEYYGLARGCTAKAIYVEGSYSPGSGKSYTFTLRKNGSTDTALEVVLSDSETSDNYATDVAISADDLLTTKIVPSNTPSTPVFKVSYLFYADPVGDPDISNTPSTWAIGTVATSTDYWSSGSEPSWPLDDGECHFTVTNDGDTCSITAKMADFTGGVGWNIAGTPTANTVTMKVGKSGDANENAMVVLTNNEQAFISGLTTSIKWEAMVESSTSHTDGDLKTGILTLTATLD